MLIIANLRHTIGRVKRVGSKIVSQREESMLAQCVRLQMRIEKSAVGVPRFREEACLLHSLCSTLTCMSRYEDRMQRTKGDAV